MANKKYLIIASSVILFGLIVWMLFRDSGNKDTKKTGTVKKEKSFWDFSSSGPGDEFIPEKLPSGDYKLDPNITKKQMISEYRRRAQYPEYSEPIPVINGKANDSIKSETDIYEQKVNNPNNPNGPFLIHFLEKNNYYPGETAVIFAYLVDGSGAKIPSNGKLTATLTETGGAGGKVLSRVTMADNGGKFDKVAGDLIYTAAFSTNGFSEKPHNYTIVLKYDVPKKELFATNSFNFGGLNITRPTSLGDKSTGKDLIINMQVQIQKKGNYHIQASLYTHSGIPIGRAQARYAFDPGKQDIELKWYGKLLCDIGENGPYKIKYMLLANVTEMPGPRSERLENVYETGPYDVKTFTCDPFNDQFYSEKADHLEKEMEKEK